VSVWMLTIPATTSFAVERFGGKWPTTVSCDGTGRLYATGLTGSKEFVPGRDTPRGTEYHYNIDAHSSEKTGTGLNAIYAVTAL
jgi:hypothetical protein